jgi:hypothetical protein
MLLFLEELKSKNFTLYNFGLVCFIASMLFLGLSKTTSNQIVGINGWIKPFKFAFSTFVYAWAMAWYISYLPNYNSNYFNWAIIILLGFEIIYIAIQAARGQLSHFNLSTSFYAFMYSMMALAATLVTIYTAYIAVLFFTNTIPNLPLYYIWSIRLALIIFVIFSFEGFVMGSRLNHTIGGADGGSGLPLLNWSTKFGDPRVAHFIGMHALQVLPILANYLVKNTKAVFIISMLYFLLAVFTLIQALNAKPFIKINS